MGVCLHASPSALTISPQLHNGLFRESNNKTQILKKTKHNLACVHLTLKTTNRCHVRHSRRQTGSLMGNHETGQEDRQEESFILKPL